MQFLNQGSQTQIDPRGSNPRGALWRCCNSGGTWTLLKTAFTSYVLRKVTGMSFLSTAVSTFLVHYIYCSSSRKLFTRWPSTFTLVNKLNSLNVNYSKIPKKHRGPRVWDSYRKLCLCPLCMWPINVCELRVVAQLKHSVYCVFEKFCTVSSGITSPKFWGEPKNLFWGKTVWF